MSTRATQTLLLIVMLLVPNVHGVEPPGSFVEQLTPMERTQIGVEAMTPGEVVALDAAVQRFLAAKREVVVRATESEVRDGPFEEIARRDAMLAQAKRELVESKPAVQVTEAEAKESFLGRAKVLLRPGTKVEYARIDTHLVDPFSGWRKGTRFRLANGNVWQATEGEYWSPSRPAGLKAAIVPGLSGSFFLEIEGVGRRTRVTLVSP